MTSSVHNTHDSKLQEIAAEYTRAGYEVTLEPSPESLPFSLAGYRPDLVARKGDCGFIVEIKSSAAAARMSVDRLRAVADEVAQHDGWRFLLVTADEIPGEEFPGIKENLVSWNEILHRARHAKQLNDMGEQEAAYLLLWIAFEQMLRFHAKQVSLPIERLNPSLLIRHLYSCGELTMPQFDVALLCQQTRNRIAHGVKSPELSETVRQLMRLLDELGTEWAPENSAT